MKTFGTKSRTTDPEGAETPAPISPFILRPASFLRGLRLLARQLAAGVLPGAHASRQPGRAREFSQYRAYQPGDDPRHIDWKLYARSDRYFLRESEIETAITLRIILDSTASMQHMDATGPAAGVSKFDFARAIAAAFASLAEAQGDRVELYAVADGRVVSAARGRQRQSFGRILFTLEQLRSAGHWPLDPLALSKAVDQGSRGGGAKSSRALVVVISDLHERAEEIRAGLAGLRTAGNELLLLHLLGRDETEFPFFGPIRFEDWETGEVVETDAKTARAAWLEGQRRCIELWEHTWPGKRFEYVPVRLDEPVDRALRKYLSKRMKG